MPMLGFNGNIIGTTAGTWIKSTNHAKLNSLQNILVKCDCVTGSYIDGKSSNLIAVITPDVASGSTIIFNPVNPLSVSIFKRRMDSITITLTDQNGVELDMGTDNGNDLPELFQVVLSISKY